MTGGCLGRPAALRREDGSALVEFVWLGLLLLLPLVYVLLSVFDAQRAAFGASAASRAASRAFVLAPSESVAREHAQQAADVALADQGISAGSAALTVSCSPDPSRCLSPGSMITVSVTVRQPLPLLPSGVGGDAPSVRVSSTSVEPYGTFREDRS